MERKETGEELKAYEVWSVTEGSRKERMGKASEAVGMSVPQLYKWRKKFKWDEKEEKRVALERKETDKELAKAKAQSAVKQLKFLDKGMKRAEAVLDDPNAKFLGSLGEASRVGMEMGRRKDEILRKEGASGDKGKGSVIMAVVKALAEKGVTTETRILEGDVDALRELMKKEKEEDGNETSDGVQSGT